MLLFNPNKYFTVTEFLAKFIHKPNLSIILAQNKSPHTVSASTFVEKLSILVGPNGKYTAVFYFNKFMFSVSFKNVTTLNVDQHYLL